MGTPVSLCLLVCSFLRSSALTSPVSVSSRSLTERRTFAMKVLMDSIAIASGSPAVMRSPSQSLRRFSTRPSPSRSSRHCFNLFIASVPDPLWCLRPLVASDPSPRLVFVCKYPEGEGVPELPVLPVPVQVPRTSGQVNVGAKQHAPVSPSPSRKRGTNVRHEP